MIGQIGAVSLPDVDAVAVANRLQVYALCKTQAREKGVAEAFVAGHPADFEGRRAAAVDTGDVLLRAGDILRPDAVPRRVGPAPEPEPLAVGPVLEIVARPPAGLRDVRDLVLLEAGRLEPLHRPH